MISVILMKIIVVTFGVAFMVVLLVVMVVDNCELPHSAQLHHYQRQKQRAMVMQM